MNLIDSIFLTLVNAVICICLPKLLSVLTTANSKRTAPLPTVSKPKEKGTEASSYVYQTIDI